MISVPLPSAPKLTGAAFQFIDRVHVVAHEDVHLLVEQLGDISDLVDEVRSELAGLREIFDDVGLGDAHVDAVQEHHVLDVLRGASADDGHDADSGDAAQHLGDVLDDRKVGAGRAAGHDRHHVLVHARAIIPRTLSDDRVVLAATSVFASDSASSLVRGIATAVSIITS